VRVDGLAVVQPGRFSTDSACRLAAPPPAGGQGRKPLGSSNSKLRKGPLHDDGALTSSAAWMSGAPAARPTRRALLLRYGPWSSRQLRRPTALARPPDAWARATRVSRA